MVFSMSGSNGTLSLTSLGVRFCVTSHYSTAFAVRSSDSSWSERTMMDVGLFKKTQLPLREVYVKTDAEALNLTI